MWVWRGDAGTGVEGTNDGAAGMHHSAEKTRRKWCGMGGSDGKRSCRRSGGDEE